MKRFLLIAFSCLLATSAQAGITPEEIDLAAATVQPQVVDFLKSQ